LVSESDRLIDVCYRFREAFSSFVVKYGRRAKTLRELQVRGGSIRVVHTKANYADVLRVLLFFGPLAGVFDNVIAALFTL